MKKPSTKVKKGEKCKLVKPYYSGLTDLHRKHGVIVGETRDKKMWQVRWDGIKAVYPYPKVGGFLKKISKIKKSKILGNYRKL